MLDKSPTEREVLFIGGRRGCNKPEPTQVSKLGAQNWLGCGSATFQTRGLTSILVSAAPSRKP